MSMKNEMADVRERNEIAKKASKNPELLPRRTTPRHS